MLDFDAEEVETRFLAGGAKASLARSASGSISMPCSRRGVPLQIGLARLF
jgi:hypothetical protein